jgi:hypothetical protein
MLTDYLGPVYTMLTVPFPSSSCIHYVDSFPSSCVHYVDSFSSFCIHYVDSFSSSCIHYVESFSSSCIHYVDSFSGLSIFLLPYNSIFLCTPLLIYDSLSIYLSNSLNIPIPIRTIYARDIDQYKYYESCIVSSCVK